MNQKPNLHLQNLGVNFYRKKWILHMHRVQRNRFPKSINDETQTNWNKKTSAASEDKKFLDIRCRKGPTKGSTISLTPCSTDPLRS
jgi:hypothetical protein